MVFLEGENTLFDAMCLQVFLR